MRYLGSKWISKATGRGYYVTGVVPFLGTETASRLYFRQMLGKQLELEDKEILDSSGLLYRRAQDLLHQADEIPWPGEVFICHEFHRWEATGRYCHMPLGAYLKKLDCGCHEVRRVNPRHLRDDRFYSKERE